MIPLRTDRLKQDVKKAVPWLLVAVWLSALTAWKMIETVPVAERSDALFVLAGILSVLLGVFLTVVAWQVTVVLAHVIQRYSDDRGDADVQG